MKAIVTGCTRNIGITIIRALASSGHEVIGIDDRPMPLGLRSRYAAKYDFYKAESEEEEYEGVEGLVRKHRPSVLITGRLTPLLARHAHQLSSYTNLLLPDPRSYERLTDKLWLYRRCQELGIPAPRPMSERQARDVLSQGQVGTAEPTVVIKPREDFGAGQGVKMIRDVEAIAPTLEEVGREFGSAFLSEFVPGPPEDIVAVKLLFDQESRLVDFFAFEKLRLWPPKVGVTALGRSIFVPDLVERLLPIFETLKWRGAADAEFKIDEATGEAKLLEINGRFTGALAFSTACGVNFPKLVCDAAIGKSTPSDLVPRYREGILYWNPKSFAKSVWADWRKSGCRWRTVSDALSQVKGKKVSTLWQFDDPAPILGKTLIICKDVMTKHRSPNQPQTRYSRFGPNGSSTS